MSERGTILSIVKLFSTYIRESVSKLFVVHLPFFWEQVVGMYSIRTIRLWHHISPIYHAVFRPQLISTAFNIFIPTSALSSALCNSCQGVGGWVVGWYSSLDSINSRCVLTYFTRFVSCLFTRLTKCVWHASLLLKRMSTHVRFENIGVHSRGRSDATEWFVWERKIRSRAGVSTSKNVWASNNARVIWHCGEQEPHWAALPGFGLKKSITQIFNWPA